MKRLLSLVAMGLSLASCGPLSSNNSVLTAVRGALQQRSAGESVTSQDPRFALTREMIESSPSELVLFGVIERETGATGAKVAENGNYSTWLTLDGVSVVLWDGLIVGTRGLGDDLMGADFAELHGALQGGGGQIVRIADYLGSQDQIERRSFVCDVVYVGADTIEIFDISYQTRHFTETCASTANSFENQYWVTPDGIVVQSRQWVSPLVGQIDVQFL